MPATLFRDSARSAERGAAVSEGATAASQGSNASPSREARGATSTVRINNSTDSGGGDDPFTACEESQCLAGFSQELASGGCSQLSQEPHARFRFAY